MESSAVAEAHGRPAALAAVPAGGATAARRLGVLMRWGGPTAYLAALATAIAGQGLPLMRDRLLLWIVLGLIAFSLADPRGVARGLVLEWLPFAVVLLAYDRLRGLADELLFRAHTWPQLHVDEWLFGGAVPTVGLQHALYHGPGALRWYDYGTWAVYMSHFFATLVVAMALWLAARRHFRRYAAMVSLLALAGFATYALFPAVPPWLAGQQGALPEVHRLVGVVWGGVGLPVMGPLFEKGTEYSNEVAAMPSLHAAYALAIALFLWPLARRWWWRVLLAAYPPAMGFALVYSGEHYVADVLVGWIYAVAVFLAVETVARRWSRRRAGALGAKDRGG